MHLLFIAPVCVAAAALCCGASAGLYTGSGGRVANNDATGTVFTIDVADSLVVADLSVTLTNFRHAHAGDLVATLTHVPSGASALLFDRIGRTATASRDKGDASDFHGDYTFADGGASLWAAADTANGSGRMPGGTFAATGSGIDTAAATGPAALSLAHVFAGIDAHGEWQLHISDHAAGHSLNNDWGWSLAFTVVPGPGALALVAAAGVAGSLGRRR